MVRVFPPPIKRVLFVVYPRSADGRRRGFLTLISCRCAVVLACPGRTVDLLFVVRGIVVFLFASRSVRRTDTRSKTRWGRLAVSSGLTYGVGGD